MAVIAETVMTVAASAVGGTALPVAVVEADAVIQVDAVIQYEAATAEEAAELMQDALHQLMGLDNTVVKELKAGVHEPWRLRLAGGNKALLKVQLATLCMTGHILPTDRDAVLALADQPPSPAVAMRMARVCRPHLLRWCPEHAEGGRLPAEVDYSTHTLVGALTSGALVKMAIVVQAETPIEITLLFDILVDGTRVTAPLRSAVEAMETNVAELLAEGKYWKAIRRMLVAAAMRGQHKTIEELRAFMATPTIVDLSAKYNRMYAYEDAARRYTHNFHLLVAAKEWPFDNGRVTPSNRAQFLRAVRGYRSDAWTALNDASKAFLQARSITQLTT